MEEKEKKIIELVDCGQERYCVRANFEVLGRMWDNEAEEFVVVKPKCESESACLMIVMVGKEVIDHIVVGEEPIKVTSNLSQYPSVKVGFSFSRADGYVKNSEIEDFYFLKAMKPTDFVPVEPERKENIDYLIAKGFTGSKLANNELLFYGVNGEVVSTVKLSGFVQEQSDLGEADESKETFVKGKTTKNLLNEGEDGTSPYATEDFVSRNVSNVKSISVNGVEQEITDGNIDIEVPTNVADLGDAADYAKVIQVSEIENSVGELSEQVGQNNQNISGINEQIGQVSQDITSLNSKTDNLNDNVSGLSEDISGLSSKVDSVETTANNAKAIAEGKATGYVFDTYTDMITWVGTHSAELKLGDNLYIRAVNVPDYWWDGTNVQQLETQKVDLSGYQQKLTVGENITIENNVISASDVVTTNTDQTILGKKSFKTLKTDNIQIAQNITDGSNSVSIKQISDGITPATESKAGTVLVNRRYGLRMGGNNLSTLVIQSADNSQIDDGTDSFHAITPKNIDYAVKVGITTNTNTLTDEEKANAKTWLGVPQFSATQLADGSYSLSITTGV